MSELEDSPAVPAPTEAERAEADALPLDVRFTLGDRITGVQQAFLEKNGFLVFGGVLSTDEVKMVEDEIEAVQQKVITESIDAIRGIPVMMGRGLDGGPFLQRLPFTSLLSPRIGALVRDVRFMPVRSLIGARTRVGDEEKDGVVLNRYVRAPGSLRPGLGWHTDGLRDIFYGRMPEQMLNVGLHFDRVRAGDGGLRIIPGSHRQGLWSMVFRKPYFVSNRPDPSEIAVETEPGDLTVHDGRTWHRVEPSPYDDARSLRRSMYVPYLTEPYAPKHEHSGTPLYHRVFRAALGARSAWNSWRQPPTDRAA